MPHLTAALVGLLALAALMPQPARACAAYACLPDQFVPRGGTVPANMPGIAWLPGQRWQNGLSRTAPSDLRFECRGLAGTPSSPPFDVVGSPARESAAAVLPTNLVAGEHCTLTTQVEPCEILYERVEPVPPGQPSFVEARAELDVVEPAPLPSELGRIELTPSMREQVEVPESGMCSETVEACVVRAGLRLSAAAEPWKNVLVYETEVDGKRWRAELGSVRAPAEFGGSNVGRAADIFFTALEPLTDTNRSSGLAPGRHTVVIKATLPGTTLELATDPLTFELDCGSAAGCSVARGSQDGANRGVLYWLGLSTWMLIWRRRWRAANRVRSCALL